MPGLVHCIRVMPEAAVTGTVFTSVQWPRTTHGSALMPKVRGEPTSWFPQEEDRQEPAWPTLLAQYYKNTIAEEEDLRMRAALEKVVAERRAGRARAAGVDLNLQAQDLRQDERDLDLEPKNTVDDQINLAQRRQQLLLIKAGVVDHEAEESQKLLQADALRDAEVRAQLKSMEKERRAIEGLEHVKKEMEKRAEQRNGVPGLPALNEFGQRIMYKESCEAEHDTVFRNGRCIVGGEEEDAQTPEEIAAFNAKNKVRDELDTLLTTKHQLAEKHDKATSHMADVRDEAKIIHRQLEYLQKHQQPSEELKSEVQVLEKRRTQTEAELKLAEEESKKAKTALEKSQDEVKAKKAELREKLKELKSVQQAEKDRDEKDLVNLHKLKEESDQRMIKDDEKMAVEEKKVQAVLGHRDTLLASQEHLHKNDDNDDFQNQRNTFAALERNVGAEAKADEEHNHSDMAKLHTRQLELAKRADSELQLAIRDAASRGGAGQQIKDSKLPLDDEDALRRGNQTLGKLLKDDVAAEQAQRDALLKSADVQSNKNSIAMRMQNTDTELNTNQSSVPVCLALLSNSCGDTKPRRRQKSCLSRFL